MNRGNISGLVSGTEQVVFDYEVTGSAASSIFTGNILNGNEDGWYTILLNVVGGANSQVPYLQVNGDQGANYGRCGILASGTTVANSSATGQTAVQYAGGNINQVCFSCVRLYAKSGAVRLFSGISSAGISGISVAAIRVSGQVWSNTSDNIVSFSFSNAVGNGYGVGTRVIILKSNNFTDGMKFGNITAPYIKGAWVRVGTSTLASPASSVTFPNLNGDRDVIYRLIACPKASGNIQGKLRFNGDSGSNYGCQYLVAEGSLLGTTPDAPSSFHYLGINTTASGRSAQCELLVFAKSGFLRPSIAIPLDGAAGTTVRSISLIGQSWSNTSDPINSITVFTAANNFDTGSQFDLYALRPNG